MDRDHRGRSLKAWLAAGCLALAGWTAPAWAALTIAPITWNVVGLDSNSPSTGPYQFPVGARVCAVGAASNGAVTATFAFQTGGTNNGETACSGGEANPNVGDSANACVFLRAGSLASYQLDGDLTTAGIQAIPSGQCRDAYFEVQVDRNTLAYGTARRYTITATDASGSIVTPQPREIYIERLISQNRNSVQDVRYSASLAANAPFPTPLGSMTSVSAGGSFGLAVGGIYDIRLDASTATQGYEQLETFANFSNAVFRILQVQSTYTANSSLLINGGNQPATTDVLYANGCNWQLSPVLPNYLGCQNVGKAGGTISATYRIQVLTVPGGSSSTLNTLIYDYSGSSFHYNADTGSGGRTIVIIDPLTATFSKSFLPASINPNGTSRLTFTINNPNASTVAGYSFTDALPAGLQVAATPNAATSGCNASGSPTFAPSAGATTISFSNGSIVAYGTCTVSVDVTGSVVGTYNNGTAPNALVQLFVNATGTGQFATATLSITENIPSIPVGADCGLSRVNLATADFTTQQTAGSATLGNNYLIRHPTSPLSSISFIPGGTSPNGVESTVTPGRGNAGRAWSGTGFNGTNVQSPGSQILFTVDSRQYRNIRVDFWTGGNNTGWNSNNNPYYFAYSTDGGLNFTNMTPASVLVSKNSYQNIIANIPFSAASTILRMIPTGTAPSFTAENFVDDIVMSGCPRLSPPTITKAFGVSSIAVGATTTLTLTISNPNAAALTGVNVTDPMPSGISINAAPAPSTTCTGATLTAPSGANSTISLSGATINASSSCTVTVSVTGTTAGLKVNTTTAVAATESGTNTGANGIATANLLVIAPPTISKTFTNNPIVVGTTSRLLFTITNPNTATSISSVAFSDTFPAGMVVATPPASTNNCGGTWTATAGNNTVSLSGVSLAPGVSCTVLVNVSVSSAGTFNNVSGAVSHVVAGVTRNGNTASASLVATAPVPRIGLSKRIALSPTGPWGEFVSLPLNGNVYYQFTIENTGDVVLNRPASTFWVTDPSLPGGSFCSGPPTQLTVPTPAVETHIYECVVGPFSANQQNLTNTATATGVNGGTTVTDTDTASYTTKLPNLLASKTRTVPAGAVDTSAGSVDVTYRITVQNQGPSLTVNSTLAPIVVEDTLQTGFTYLGFTSADPAWSCSLVQVAPRNKVSCVYSNVLVSTGVLTLDLNVRVPQGATNVNNTAIVLYGGDPECVVTNPDPVAPYNQCQAPYFGGTVPVTLSDVSVQIEGGQLVVDYGVAAEVGTLGYRVLAGRGGLQLASNLGNDMVVAKGAGFEPTRYEARGTYAGQTQVWIQEIGVDGKRETFGPFGVGTQAGERNLLLPTDWQAIAAEQNGFRQAQAASIRSRSNGEAVEAELRVSSTGLVRVRHEDLVAAGIDWTGVSARSVMLARGSSAVAMRYEGPEAFGPGSSIYFVGEAISDSQYTRTAVYRLKVSDVLDARQMRTVYSGAGVNPPTDVVRDSLVHDPNRGYDLASAHTDPWYARRLTRSNAPVSGVDEVFVVADRAASSDAERIEVGMWGGIEFAANPDHSVRLVLNGTEIARSRFDGMTYHRVTVDLPRGLLVTGNNTLRMELIGDTGLNVDLVYLDSIKVSYLRSLNAASNRIAFSGSTRGSDTGSVVSDRVFSDDFSDDGVAACRSGTPGCVTYRVKGLTQPDVNLFRIGADGVAAQLTGARVTAVAGGFELSFASMESAGDRYRIEPAAGSVVATVAPKLRVTDPLAGGAAQYLIISHPSFMGDLTPLISARQADGLTVRVVDVEALYAYYNRGSVDPGAIEAAISDAYERLGTRYVLLVGGDTYDYFNYLGANSQSFIPTYYRPTGPIVRFAPVDSPYADVDMDGMPDVAIGRFPVRTRAELGAMIAKTLAYRVAPHAGKVLAISDRAGSNGVDYRQQLVSLTGLLGPNSVNAAVDLGSYPATSAGLLAARADVATAVNAGQALTVFFGHSAPASWASEGLITASVVHGGVFNNASQPTVAWVLGCYGSYFTSPTYNTVSQALVVQANGGGAAAILGASGLTNIESDLAWLGALRPTMSTSRIGDALMQSVRQLSHPDMRHMDVTVGGVLLGDPALRVRN